MQSRLELDNFYYGVAANTVDEIKESFAGGTQLTVRLCPLVREAHPALAQVPPALRGQLDQATGA